MTIKEILDKLEKANKDLPVFLTNTLSVELTGEVHSWRGDYSQLALGYDLYGRVEKPVTVGKLKDLLKSCIGKKFIGYKGGEFLMSKRTSVYLDNYGECTGHYIYDITYNARGCYLKIEKEL